MKLDTLLDSKETMLYWREPWEVINSGGYNVLAHITMSATVDDCINIARVTAVKNGFKTESDKDLLLDFIAVHWASQE